MERQTEGRGRDTADGFLKAVQPVKDMPGSDFRLADLRAFAVPLPYEGSDC